MRSFVGVEIFPEFTVKTLHSIKMHEINWIDFFIIIIMKWEEMCAIHEDGGWSIDVVHTSTKCDLIE